MRGAKPPCGWDSDGRIPTIVECGLVPPLDMTMSTHCAALHPDPRSNGLGVSSMAHMFFGTVTGVASIAADVPETPLEVKPIRQKLEGMEAILQPQVDMIKKMISHVRAMQDFGTGDYLDPDGEIEEMSDECVNRLQAFVATLMRGSEKLDSSLGISSFQRGQLHEIYAHIIAIAQQAIGLIQTLAGVIVTHDINAEPPPTQIWERLDDMLSDLKALPS